MDSIAMTTQDIRALLDYHYWARDRVLDAAAGIDNVEFTAPRGSSFSSIRDTLVHMYFAESAWYARWHGHSPSKFPEFTEFGDVASLRRAWVDLEHKVREFIEPMTDADLQQVVDYQLMSGTEAASPMWQMVQHVVNHASYHRGQVTTMLRQAAAEPPKSMDLIAFYRERAKPQEADAPKA